MPRCQIHDSGFLPIGPGINDEDDKSYLICKVSSISQSHYNCEITKTISDGLTNADQPALDVAIENRYFPRRLE
jgi:hypothetical protein